MSNPLYLSAADLGDSRLALTLGQGLPTSIKVKVGTAEKEFPVSYWRKPAIKCGKYVHPTTGQTLDVDAKRIDGWVDKFNQMRVAKREIPAPATHSDDPRDNLGYVIGAEREGDELSLTYQVIGEDGAVVAARNSCSICIDPDYRDESGKSWGEAIVHSAFTPKPVISGMGSFVPFAASRGAQAATPIYYLSTDTGGPMLDPKSLREALGAPVEIPDDKLIEHAKGVAAKVKTAEADKTAALSRATAAETKVTELEGKVTNLSRAPAAPDPEILRDRRELSIGKIELSVQRGDMPPFIADKLKKMVGESAKPNAFMLSRSDDMGDRPVDAILAMFDGAKLAPKLGTQTPVQLSRAVPGDDPTDEDKELDAGRKQAKEYTDSMMLSRGIAPAK
jgi:hypothetical protein